MGEKYYICGPTMDHTIFFPAHYEAKNGLSEAHEMSRAAIAREAIEK